MTAHRAFRNAVRSVRLPRSLRGGSSAWLLGLPVGVGRWLKWLMPGLSMKRWMLMSAGGVLLVSLGFAILVKLTPIFRLMQFFGDVMEWTVRFVPSYVSGPMVIAIGFTLVWWGQRRTFGSITAALVPGQDAGLVDMLWDHRRLDRGPRIVVIGGGTGLSTMLRGLKVLTTNLVAIVTVADDGGSSGRLRREIGVLPPGDIRNCLAALADEERLITELFQYRFEAGDGLVGHSFGNLFLTALSEVSGDLERAVEASSKVLAIKGEVFPATLSDVRLWAELEDGRRIEGESNIPKAKGKIVGIGCTPENPPALPKAIAAIRNADFIVIGPGSLYTSVIPNLLVPEIRDAIAASRVPCVYVSNVMTQPGETDGYSVADHIEAIDRVCGGDRLFDAVLVQRRPPSEWSVKNYVEEGAFPVVVDGDRVAALGRRLIRADVMDEDEMGLVRHNPGRLAGVLMRWFVQARRGN